MDADAKGTLPMIATGAAASPTTAGKAPVSGGRGEVVAFICENSGRPARTPSSGIRQRPSLPNFAWPLPVREVAVPCAGRLQPEHFLKALEDGVDAIGVICCADDNCHHVEGSRRCRRRLEYVGGLIEQAGLERDRLIILQLPGTAAEDMALGVGTALAAPALDKKIAAVREAFLARLATLSRNPLGKGELPDESPYEVDSADGSD
jgi:coenzyme F420-reducing hydrogenase delta subunit